MKKSFVSLFFLIFLTILCGCSKGIDYKISPENHPSLKNQITYMDKKTVWSMGLDSVLTPEEQIKSSDENLDFISRIAKKEAEIEEAKRRNIESRTVLPAGFSELSVNNRLFTPKNEKKIDTIFPSLLGFGSLDVSELNQNVYDLIDGFIISCNKKNLDINLISENSRFLKPVFEYDFAMLPEIKDYILGKPFVVTEKGFNEFQLPVRFIADDGFYDAVVFLVVNDKKYLIEQVYYRGLENE